MIGRGAVWFSTSALRILVETAASRSLAFLGTAPASKMEGFSLAATRQPLDGHYRRRFQVSIRALSVLSCKAGGLSGSPSKLQVMLRLSYILLKRMAKIRACGWAAIRAVTALLEWSHRVRSLPSRSMSVGTRPRAKQRMEPSRLGSGTFGRVLIPFAKAATLATLLASPQSRALRSK